MLRKFLYDENGGVVEQAIIIGILAVIGATAFLLMRPTLTQIFENVQEQLDEI